MIVGVDAAWEAQLTRRDPLSIAVGEFHQLLALSPPVDGLRSKSRRSNTASYEPTPGRDTNLRPGVGYLDHSGPNRRTLAVEEPES